MEIIKKKNELQVKCLQLKTQCPFVIKHGQIKKRSRIAKNKDQKLARTTSIAIIPLNKITFEMKLIEDLTVTNEGQVRLSSALNHVSFGFHHTIGEAVEYFKEINCYSIKLKQDNNIPFCTVEDILKVTNLIYGNTNLRLILEEFGNKIQLFEQDIQYQFVTSPQIQAKDEEMNEFMQFCFDYLKNQEEYECSQNRSSLLSIEQNLQQSIKQANRTLYEKENQQSISDTSPQNSPHFQFSSETKQNNPIHIAQESDLKEPIGLKMFAYIVGKINFETKDFEIIYQGYSAGYLNLLGLDQQSLIQLTLRGKRIDLFKDVKDITNYSALRMEEWTLFYPQTSQISSNIVTFDGFPIKIHQNIKRVDPPNKFQGSLKFESEYTFQITEIDVDIRELENLMAYRQQLNRYPNSLPIDTLIQRELSFKFEDIEYSVHSEDFINKFYPAIQSREENSPQIKPCQYKLLQ